MYRMTGVCPYFTDTILNCYVVPKSHPIKKIGMGRASSMYGEKRGAYRILVGKSEE